jgi:WD40 repeat protein
MLEGHDGAVRDCVWAPDGKTVITAGDDSVKIWDRYEYVCIHVCMCVCI